MIAQYVAMLGWTSAVVAVWYCFTNHLWQADGVFVILFSVIIALVSGVLSYGINR